MANDENDPASEREQTNKSLRIERHKADQALGEELAAIDETADVVLALARDRADQVLAATRAKTDRELTREPGTATLENITLERAREDQILDQERAHADATLREERAEHVAALSRERHATDSDLASERARSDHSLARRDEFLAVVSHELRNLLTTIAGSAELIAAAVARDNHVDQVRQSAQRIQRASTRMTRLVGDLVDVASIEAGTLAVTLERGEPAPVVIEAVETFLTAASARGLSLVIEELPPSSPLAFDPSRILQVLANLLSNAIKFRPAGGSVVVRVERIDSDMRFAVSDTGPGIPDPQLQTVFERFRQLHGNDRRGLGLGLYISKAIVEGHGGRIWAERRSGGGSTFYFTLPI